MIPREPLGRFNWLDSRALPQLAVLEFKDVILSLEECRVFVQRQEVRLKPQEFRLLKFFMSYPQQVWSRSQLLT